MSLIQQESLETSHSKNHVGSSSQVGISPSKALGKHFQEQMIMFVLN